MDYLDLEGKYSYMYDGFNESEANGQPDDGKMRYAAKLVTTSPSFALINAFDLDWEHSQYYINGEHITSTGHLVKLINDNMGGGTTPDPDPETDTVYEWEMRFKKTSVGNVSIPEAISGASRETPVEMTEEMWDGWLNSSNDNSSFAYGWLCMFERESGTNKYTGGLNGPVLISSLQESIVTNIIYCASDTKPLLPSNDAVVADDNMPLGGVDINGNVVMNGSDPAYRWYDKMNAELNGALSLWSASRLSFLNGGRANNAEWNGPFPMSSTSTSTNSPWWDEVFKNSVDKPTAPTYDGEYDGSDVHLDGWKHNPEEMGDDESRWMSTCLVSGDGFYSGNWTDPTKISAANGYSVYYESYYKVFDFGHNITTSEYPVLNEGRTAITNMNGWSVNYVSVDGKCTWQLSIVKRGSKYDDTWIGPIRMTSLDGNAYKMLFKNSETKPDAPTITPPNYTGWSESPVNPPTGQSTYMTSNYQRYDLSYVYPEWSDPICITGANGQNGVDGANIEFIYRREKTDHLDLEHFPITNSATENNHIPDGWENNPQGVSSTYMYEWCAIRHKPAGENVQWNNFGDPFIWAKWGANGIDGDGTEYIFTYTMTAASPVKYTSTTALPTEGSVAQLNSSDPATWGDNPISVSETAPFMWCQVGRVKYKNDENENTVIDTITWSDPSLWANFSREVQAKGLVVEVSNEMMGIPVTATTVNADWEETAYVRMYSNKDLIDITEITVTPSQQINGMTITHTLVSDPDAASNGKQVGKVDISIDEGSTFPAQGMSVNISVKNSDGDVRHGTINLAGLSFGADGEMYSLNVSAATIKKNKDNTHPFTPEEIEVYIKHTKGTNGMENLSINSVGTESFTVKYAIDGDWSNSASLTDSTVSLGTGSGKVNPTSIIEFKLYYNTDILVDQESVQVIRDGEQGLKGTDGADGDTQEFIYFLHSGSEERIWNLDDNDNPYAWNTDDLQSEDAIPPAYAVGSNFDTTDPSTYLNKWMDNPVSVSPEYRYLYYSTRTVTCTTEYDSESGITEKNYTYGRYSSPIPWSVYGKSGIDGDGVEYIYFLSSSTAFDFTTENATNAQNGNNPTLWNSSSNTDRNGKTYSQGEYVGPAQANDTENYWYDDPQSLEPTKRTQWISSRKYNGSTKTWGQFTPPVVWNTLAENGKNYSLSVSNTLIPLSTTWNDKKTTGDYSEDITVQILLNGSPLSGITVTNGNGQQVSNTSTDPKKVIFNFSVDEGTTLANTISYPYTAKYEQGSETVTFNFNITVVPMVTGKTGDEGPQGASVKIIGTVPTLEEKNAVQTAGTFNGKDLESGDGVICSEDGHLWVWTEDENGQNGQFVDCGQIQGEQGEMAWVHIAWSYWSNGREGGTSTGAIAYDVTKDPSKEYRYMGIYSDHKPDDERQHPEYYTWSEIVGENAVSFQVYTNVQYIAYDPNETDEEDKFITKTINLGISQTNGSSQTLISKTYYVDSKSGTFRLRYRRDNSTYTNFTNATANNTQLSVTNINPSTSITIELQRSTNNGSTFSTIDTKTLFLEKNGINGTNGVDGTNIEYVYYLTNSASQSFTDNADPRNWINLPNYDTTDFPFNDTFHTETATAGWTTEDGVAAYNGWTDSPRGVRNNAKYEFYSVRESYIDANNEKHWYEFSKPVTFSSFGVQGLTGDGVQYIYLTLESTDVEISNNPNSWAANTSETYTGPTSGTQVWTRNPTVYSSMGEGNVQYVSTRQYKLNSEGTAKEWTKYSAPSVWSYKAKNGVNAIYYNIDTNNDNIALSVDQNGKCTSTAQKTATITLYGNGTAMTLSSATKTTSGISQTSVVTISRGTTSATLTITPTTSTVISEGASVTVTLKSGTVERSITINVTGVHYAKDGINATSVDLVTSATSIKYNPDAADVSDMYVPNVIVPYIKITDGSTVTTYAYSHSFISGNNKWGLSYYYNGVDTNSHNVTTGASNVAVGEEATTQMTFVLTYNGNRYDNETISLVSDGAKGTDGTSVEFIYYRPKTETEASKTTPIDWSSVNNDTNPAKWGNSVTGAQEGDFPFNETFQTAHPEGFVTSDDDVLSYNGWTDNPLGVTQDARFEYAAMRLKEDGVWGEFQTPFAWGTFGSDGFDGDGVEYIFSKSNTTNPHNWYNHENYQSPEYIPEASSNVWSDEPPTITQGETVYYSMRRYKLITASTVTTLLAAGDESDYYLENFANVKAWLPYSAPVVWNHYPTDGEDTEGAEYIYCRTKIDISSKWDAVEKVATGVFYGENLYGSSTPLTNYYYTYSTNNSTNKKSVNPANWVADSSNKYIHSDHKNKIWYDSPQGITKEYPYEWMAMRTNPVGADGQRTGWTKFVKPKIWSRWGSDGTDGDGVEYIFAKNFTSTDADMLPQNWYTNGDYQTTEFIPEAAEDVWFDNPPAVVEGDYTYCSIRKYKYIDSTTIGTLVSDSTIQSYYTSHFNNDSAWLPYSEPQIWSHFPTEGEDSEGEEFIYCRTKIDITDKWGVQENIASDVFYGEDLYPTNNPLTGLYYSNFGVSSLSVNPQRWDATQTAGFIEENFTRVWYDHPQGVTEEYPYEWAARRTNPVGADGQRTGWGKYGLPNIWSHYGVDGKDGDGVEYIYFRGYPNSYVMDYDTAMTTYNDIKANFAVSCNPKYWVGIGIPSGNNYKYQSNEYIPTASEAGGLSAASMNVHVLTSETSLRNVENSGQFPNGDALEEGNGAYVQSTGHLYIYDGTTFVDFGEPDENFTDYGSSGGVIVMTSSSTERWWADDPHILNAENQYQYVSTRKKRELSDEDIDEILNAIVVKCLGADNCRKIYNNLHGYNGYQTDFMNNVLKNTIDWRFFVLCVKYDSNQNITSKLLTGDWNTVTESDITKARNLINKYITYDVNGGGIKTIVAYAGTYNGSTANNGNPECAPITEKKITFGWTVYSDPTIWTTRERGEQGLQGAILRHRGNWGTYSEHPNEWYCYNSIDRDSNDGLLYTDLTTYSDTLWQCIKPFQRASVNTQWNPYEGSQYWKKASKYDFVATYTLYADSGLIKTLSTNDLVVFDDDNEIVGGMLGKSLTDDSESHEMTTDNTTNAAGDDSVRIWAGKSKNETSGKYELVNAPFNVRANGKLTAKDADIEGDLTVNTLALGDASFYYNEPTASLPKITAGEHRIVYVVNYSTTATTLAPHQDDCLYLTKITGSGTSQTQSLYKMDKGIAVQLDTKCMYMVISGNETVGNDEQTFWLVTKTGMFSVADNTQPASIIVPSSAITTNITSVNTIVGNSGAIEVTINGNVTISSSALSQNGNTYASSFNLAFDIEDNGTVTEISIQNVQTDTYNRDLEAVGLNPASTQRNGYTLTFVLKWRPLSSISGEVLTAYDELSIRYDPDNPAPPTRGTVEEYNEESSSSDIADDDEESPTRGSQYGNLIIAAVRNSGRYTLTDNLTTSKFNHSDSPFNLIARVQAFRS